MTPKTFRLLAIIVLILGALALPSVVTVKYYLQLCILALIWMIVSHGQNIIQGFSGYVSITQAGFMGIGAYCSTLLSINLNVPVWVSILIAPLVTTVFALVVGYPSLRVKGHYFAIVTLAYNMVIFTVLMNFSALTKGEAGISNIPKPEALLGGLINFQDRVAYYYLVLIIAMAMTGLAVLILHSRVGRILLAIRQNETLAVATGIAVWKYKLFAFAASAFYAAIGGALYAHYQGFINPESFGVAQSLDAILAVILGGSGTIFGPVIGAIAVVFLPEYLRFADSFRLIVYGFLLVIATIFMPSGIVGLSSDLWRRVSAMTNRLTRPMTTETHDLSVLRSAELFSKDYLAPNVALWDRDRTVPRELFKLAAEAGLTNLEIPLDFGGQGLPFSTKAKVAGILARVDFGVAMALINTQNVGTKIVKHLSPAVASRYVPELITGQRVGCTALTELSAGSDFAMIAMQATRREGGWVLKGEKAWITNAIHADTLIVYAQTRQQGDAAGIGAFLVDGRRKGFERKGATDTIGLASNGAGAFSLTDYDVPDEEVIAPPGQAFKSILNEINGARIYVAAMCCGMVEAALEVVGHYGNQRKSFGKSLQEHQGWRWQLAEASSELAAVHALVDRAAAVMDAGGDAQLIAAQTKIAATRLAERHLPKLAHAMGAEGMRRDGIFGRHLAGVSFAGLVDGSTEMLLERVAKLVRPEPSSQH